MNNFIELSNDEKLTIDGGFDGGYVFGGACIGTVGIGLMGAALTPALPVVAIGALCYAGIVGVTAGLASIGAGFVK